MGRTARDRRDRPHPKPVERIELNKEHVGWRLFAAVVLLVFGAAMLTYGFMQMLSPETGEWVTIEADFSAGESIAGEFSFLYRPGGGELSYTADRKGAASLYTRLCREAFQLFHSREAFEGVTNIYTINHHPNETLEVDPGLYAAFSAVVKSGRRELYLGPLYERYNGLFSCEDDSQLVEFDPRLSPEVAREYREYAAFANDPQSVRVELLGENRIRLFVSREYLEYAGREDIGSFIDFAWMRNAFIADCLARELTAQGYTRGVLASYDGFIRCLDESGEEYSLTIYDQKDGTAYTAAIMGYRGPKSIVGLRDYPVNDLDQGRFYRLRTGEVRTLYVDTADGMCRNAVSSLTGYAGDRGCGEILLEMIPVYIADSFRPEALEALSEAGIASICCEDGVLYPSEADVTLTRLYEKDGMRDSAASPKGK